DRPPPKETNREADRDRHFAVAAPLARWSICDDALSLFGGMSATQAKAPVLNAPAPAFYRFKLGTIEATVVSDGPLSIGDPKNTFRGPTAEELSKMMSDQFLPTNNVVLDQNVLVINTGDRLVLFETGMSSVKR